MTQLTILNKGRISNSAVGSYIGAWGKKKISSNDPIFISKFNIFSLMDWFALILILKYCIKVFIMITEFVGTALYFAP